MLRRDLTLNKVGNYFKGTIIGYEVKLLYQAWRQSATSACEGLNPCYISA